MKKLLVIVMVLLFLAGCSGKEEPIKELTPGEQFAEEYNGVESDNLFVYRSAEEAVNILKHGTGVVYFGFPECQWCQAYVPVLNEIAKTAGLEKIYYVNISSDRKDNTAAYQEIVELLGERLQYDEEGKGRIYVPEIVFVIEGEIIGNEHTTSKDTLGYEKAEDFWSNEDTSELKAYLEEMCLEVNKSLESCGACTL